MDDVPLAQRRMFPCAHALCDSCAEDVASRHGHCGICRAPVTPAQLVPLPDWHACTE